MDTQIVAIYCVSDDILKGLRHSAVKQRQRSDAEVMTTSIVAGLYFSGNMEKSRIFLQEHGYIPRMLEKSRFNRRQHKIAELFLVVFDLLGSFCVDFAIYNFWFFTDHNLHDRLLFTHANTASLSYANAA